MAPWLHGFAEHLPVLLLDERFLNGGFLPASRMSKVGAVGTNPTAVLHSQKTPARVEREPVLMS